MGKRTFSKPSSDPRLFDVGGKKATRFYSMFWGWMGANNTGIGTWSTDECVDRQWEILVDAREQLAAWVANPPQEKGVANGEDLRRMLDQLDNIMRRGTRNRLMDDNGVAVKPTANQIAGSDLAKDIDSKPAIGGDVEDIIGRFRS